MTTAAQRQAERIKQLEKRVPTHKTSSLPKRGTSELQEAIKKEQDEAIKTIAKTSVGTRRAEDFVQKFGVDPKKILSGITSSVTKQPTKPERTIQPQQSNTPSPTEKQKKKQAEILDPKIYAPGSGGGIVTPFTELEPDAQVGEVLVELKQNLIQTKIDEIINQIFREVDVSDLTLADRMKLDELPALEKEYQRLLDISSSPTAAASFGETNQSFYQQAQTMLLKINEIKAIKIKVDVVLKLEQLIEQKTKELTDWVNEPTFDPTKKQEMLDKVKEASRIIENVIIRNVKVKDGLITALNTAQVSVLDKIRKAEQSEIDKLKLDQSRQKTKPTIIDAEEILGEGTVDKSLQSAFDPKSFAEIFAKAFDSSPERWEKIYLDQIEGARRAAAKAEQKKVAK